MLLLSVSINLNFGEPQKRKPPLCKGRWREAPEGLLWISYCYSQNAKGNQNFFDDNPSVTALP